MGYSQLVKNDCLLLQLIVEFNMNSEYGGRMISDGDEWDRYNSCSDV